MFNHGARFLTVTCDENGMLVDSLPGIIEKAIAEGGKIKFIYTIVNFHNPLGCDLSLERRIKLLEIAKKYGILILEDDPYGYVRFEGEEIPSVFSLDREGLCSMPAVSPRYWHREPGLDGVQAGRTLSGKWRFSNRGRTPVRAWSYRLWWCGSIADWGTLSLPPEDH
jgi:hypothetical protein